MELFGVPAPLSMCMITMKNIFALSALSALIATAAAWELRIYEHADYNPGDKGWNAKYTNSVNQKILLSGKYNDGTSSFTFSGNRNNLGQKITSITLYEHYDSKGNCYGQIGYSCGGWAVKRVSAANNDKLSCIQVKYHTLGC
ncbi:hypothetical protein BGZ94_009310 [Podila epigama]|nr:hypothetical protein BGZ94_009310 [Podila epigama]